MPRHYTVLHPLESGPDVRVYVLSDRLGLAPRRVLTLFSKTSPGGVELDQAEDLFSLRFSLVYSSLIPVLDLSFRGNRPGIVTEFLTDCKPLKPSGLVPPTVAVSLSVQLAEALSYLHCKGFFCGYLKPSQLFVDNKERLIANILTPKMGLGSKPLTTESIRYCAPEYLAAESVTERGDLYSLGMIMYFLFTGYPPFLETRMRELRKKQMLAHPPRPRSLNPDIPANIEQLILELIQKDPESRPSSSDYVVAMLKSKDNSHTALVPRFRSSLVGRERELTAFRGIFDSHSGNPALRFIAIGGPSGIGKTALMHRFQSIAKARKSSTLTVSHHPGGGILDAFRQAVDSESDNSELLLAEESRANSDYFMRFLVKSLEDLSRRGLFVLCIDDLQWMDEGSLELYKMITNRQLPLMVIANYRSDELAGHWKQFRSQLADKDLLTEMHLKPLPEPEAEKLIASLLGHRTIQSAGRLVSQCKGNPFYIYESLRYMQEIGALRFRSGNWHWQPGLDVAFNVPRTVVQQIESRLSRLSEQDLAPLKVLSVLERPAQLELLSRVLCCPTSSVEDTLRLLEKTDLVEISGSLEAPAAVPSHYWIGRVVGYRLDNTQRKRIHLALAEVFEAEHLSTSDPSLGHLCVHHYLKAGCASKATEHLWGAVEWLDSAKFYSEAADLLLKALENKALALDNWKVTERTLFVLYHAGEWNRCISISKEALACCPSLNSSQKAQLSLLISRIYVITGRSKEARELITSTFELCTLPENEELIFELRAELLCCLAREGNMRLASARPEIRK